MLRLTDDTNIGAGAVTAVSPGVVYASTRAPRTVEPGVRAHDGGPRDVRPRWAVGRASVGVGTGAIRRAWDSEARLRRMEEAQGGTLYAPVGDELRDGPPAPGDGLAATLGQVVKQRAAAQQVLRSQRSSIGPMQL